MEEGPPLERPGEGMCSGEADESEQEGPICLPSQWEERVMHWVTGCPNPRLCRLLSGGCWCVIRTGRAALFESREDRSGPGLPSWLTVAMLKVTWWSLCMCLPISPFLRIPVLLEYSPVNGPI